MITGKTFQMTVKGWADSVISRKRMFVDALDFRIEERKAKIARLETTERDIEESISIKKKHVQRLLKKIGKMEYFLDLQEAWRTLKRLWRTWKHSYKRQRVPENIWRRKWIHWRRSFSLLKRQLKIYSNIDENC